MADKQWQTYSHKLATQSFTLQFKDFGYTFGHEVLQDPQHADGNVIHRKYNISYSFRKLSMALSIYFPLDTGPEVLNDIQICRSGWPFLQDCGVWDVSSAPILNHITCWLVGWIIVLLQHPVGNAIGKEHLVPTRQESVLTNILYDICTHVQWYSWMSPPLY